MRPLHIIMPMAGEGSRFLKEGWMVPKPLIQLHGTPLFIRAINSLEISDIEMKYSFIVRQEHIDKYDIDKMIRDYLPVANVYSVLKTTRGAVETCMLAEQGIDKDDAIIVMDCDLEFRSLNFVAIIKEILSKTIKEVDGGALVSFQSNMSKYSYAQIDENNKVLRTAEKEVISNHALCGAYFFSKAEGFLSAAHHLLNEVNFGKSEFYVSLLYNYLLQKGETVQLVEMEKYYSYGTPEELGRYL